MKRLFALLLSLLITLSLCACQPSGEINPTVNESVISTDPSNTETVTPTTGTIEETVPETTSPVIAPTDPVPPTEATIAAEDVEKELGIDLALEFEPNLILEINWVNTTTETTAFGNNYLIYVIQNGTELQTNEKLLYDEIAPNETFTAELTYNMVDKSMITIKITDINANICYTFTRDFDPVPFG